MEDIYSCIYHITFIFDHMTSLSYHMLLDMIKLEKEERICRKLKHNNIGE